MKRFRACSNLWGVGLAAILALGLGGCRGESRPKELRPVEVSGRSYWMPARILEAYPPIRDAYLFALAHPEVLKYVPCYCGCEEVGHGSNLDCFIDEVRPDGTVQIDEMGFT